MKQFSCLLLVLFALCACTKKEAKPRDIIPDRDVCARCVMQISDPRLAAQAVNISNGTQAVFEEIGCGVSWLEHNKYWDNYTLYVTDFRNGGWIKFDDAFFAAEYTTPMAYGVAALSDKSDLEEGKTLLDGNAVIERIMEMNKNRKKMHGGEAQ